MFAFTILNIMMRGGWRGEDSFTFRKSRMRNFATLVSSTCGTGPGPASQATFCLASAGSKPARGGVGPVARFWEAFARRLLATLAVIKRADRLAMIAAIAFQPPR